MKIDAYRGTGVLYFRIETRHRVTPAERANNVAQAKSMALLLPMTESQVNAIIMHGHRAEDFNRPFMPTLLSCSVNKRDFLTASADG